jgi:hypothetical protein
MRNSYLCNTLAIFLSLILFIGCEVTSDGEEKTDEKSDISSTNQDDFVAGNSYFAGAIYEGSEVLLFEIYFKDNNVVNAYTFYFPDADNLYTGYYQKNEGHYSRNGVDYVFTWDYETCDDTGKETLQITEGTNHDAWMSFKNEETGGTDVVRFYDYEHTSVVIDLNEVSVLIEDVECEMLGDEE